MTSPYEVAAVLFGILGVYLTVRENVWCWPTGLVNVGLSILVFWEARLYAVFLVLAVLGHLDWTRSLEASPPAGAAASPA